MDDALRNAWEQLTAKGAPFAWSVVNVRGVPTRSFDAAPPSLQALFAGTAAHGDAPYLAYRDERLSYADAHAKVASLGAFLQSRGVEPGDRVAIAMRNYPEWALAYWAAISIGAVAVGMNAWWTGPEMAYGLLDSTPKVLIADAERLATLAPHLAEVRAKHPLELVAVRTPEASAGDATPFTEAVATSASGLESVSIDPDDDVCIFYTSGTTGFPKGAVMTHRSVIANVMNLGFFNALTAMARPNPKRAAEAPGEKRPVTALLSVPLFHVTGCNCCLHPISAAGGRIFLQHKWDAGEALEIIERERVETFVGVPMMSREMVEHPDFERRDTSSLTSLGGGGAAVQPDLVEKIEKRLEKGRPGTGYGLTETSGVVSANSGADFISRPNTVGLPLPVVEARIVAEDGRDLPPGEVGELWVRGPNNVRGYWNKQEATDEAFPDGWFRTGDLATLDEHGYIAIADRAKDMVLRGGENIYCAEVEAALFDHPAVKECAVFSVPDDRFGEVPGAAVVLVAGETASEDDLRAHAAGRIAAYKVPAHFWFLDEDLPRNANGKFLKRELRERLVG